MSKSLKIIVAILCIGIVSAFSFWQYVNKPSKDFSNEKVDLLVTVSDILKRLDNDTSTVSQIMNKLMAVDGSIKKISKDAEYITIELGDSSTTSSIICQVDARHTHEFTNVKENDRIVIKGKVTACTFDEDFGLGNTIQMNFCSPYKK
ncbi:MAG: hypothetical protein IPI46_02325 [Bacteroidetes bacterium]|nr:hypothetical protein [Bacteroidota bacterium]